MATFNEPGASGHEEYISDPAKPVPFIPRPIDMGDPLQWKPWLVHDQRFVTGRPEVAVWTSAPLEKGVHIMGAPEVELFASTTGTDSDWVVKLIDLYPNDVPEAAFSHRCTTWDIVRDSLSLSLSLCVSTYSENHIHDYGGPTYEDKDL